MANFAIDYERMDLALECVHCINAGVGELLPQMVVVIRDSTFLSFFESLLKRSLQQFGWAFGSSIVDRSAAERGVTKCPSSSTYAYAPDNRPEPWSLPDLPSLSVGSIDALVACWLCKP
jgi:hypothetical protein